MELLTGLNYATIQFWAMAVGAFIIVLKMVGRFAFTRVPAFTLN